MSSYIAILYSRKHVFLGLPIMDVSVALVGTLDDGGIFYMRIRSIAAAVVLFPMSCLGLVVGGGRREERRLGRIETEHGYAKNNSYKPHPKGTDRFVVVHSPPPLARKCPPLPLPLSLGKLPLFRFVGDSGDRGDFQILRWGLSNSIPRDQFCLAAHDYFVDLRF
jgi:hypothetical protein